MRSAWRPVRFRRRQSRRASREKSLRLLVETRPLSTCAATGPVLVPATVKNGELFGSEDELRAFLEPAVAVRTPAATAIAFLGCALIDTRAW